LFFFLMCGMARAQTHHTSTSATGAWNNARWNKIVDGPSHMENSPVPLTAGSYSFLGGMGGSPIVGGITATSGVTVSFSSVAGDFEAAGNVRTMEVGSRGLPDFSNAAGAGFIKEGARVLATAGVRLVLGGVSTHKGEAMVNGGKVQFSTGDKRRPTETTVSLGQAAGIKLGILELNGRIQQMADLNSVTGTLIQQAAVTLTLKSAKTQGGGTIPGAGRVSPAVGGSVILGNGAIVFFGVAGDTAGKKLIFTPASVTVSTTVQASSVLKLDLLTGAVDNGDAGTAADALQQDGSTALQSHVKPLLDDLNNMAEWATDDSWKALDWATLGESAPSGAFDNSVMALPALSDPTAWDTTSLQSAGTLAVVQVPEPSRLLLMLGSFLCLAARRKNRSNLPWLDAAEAKPVV
jgi:hypothetical protein